MRNVAIPKTVAICVIVLTLLAACLTARHAAAAPATGEAPKRVALVIGNSNYRFAPPLQNPVNDARLIADRLRQIGFTLVGGAAQTDLDRDAFTSALNSFSQLAAGADVALFYYAGHGMQLNDTNWLLPISADPQRPTDLTYQAFDIGDVLIRLERSEARFKLVLLDACRNNPFLGRGLRSASGDGLLRVDAPDGTLISYSTKPGHTALDGTGADSPYSTALAALIARPGLPVLSMFNQLGVAVKRDTNGTQEPWLSASPIEDEFMFTAPADPASAASATPIPATATPATPIPATATPAVTAPARDAAAADPQAVAPRVNVAEIRVWEWIEEERPLPRTVDVLAAPAATADTIASLKGGTVIFVTGLLSDKNWLQIQLPDNVTTGYIRADRLPEIAAVEAPPPPAALPTGGQASVAAPAPRPPVQPIYQLAPPPPPPPVEGRPVVHDTATLLIGDRVVPLSGIEGFGGSMVAGFQGFLASQGNAVSCTPGDPGRYVCRTPAQVDVAAAALANGAATAAPDAPQSYLDQQTQAQHKAVGIWQKAAPPPAEPDPLPPRVIYAAGAPAPVYVAAAVDPGVEPGGAAEPFLTDYGVAEIDGRPVTVIDGERVVIEHDDHGGWMYHDQRGLAHDMPQPYQHDVEHFQASRPWPARGPGGSSLPFPQAGPGLLQAGPGLPRGSQIAQQAPQGAGSPFGERHEYRPDLRTQSHPQAAVPPAAAPRPTAAPAATSFARSSPEPAHMVAPMQRPVASPVVASPVVASPVVASPVVASPVVASPVVASPVVASPVVASPVVASPVVASPVAASPVAARRVASPVAHTGSLPVQRPTINPAAMHTAPPPMQRPPPVALHPVVAPRVCKKLPC